MLSVPNLVPDTYFDAFTRPYINNKLEEKTCGSGPSLLAVFDDDKNFHTITLQIKVHSFLYNYFIISVFKKLSNKLSSFLIFKLNAT